MIVQWYPEIQTDNLLIIKARSCLLSNFNEHNCYLQHCHLLYQFQHFLST